VSAAGSTMPTAETGPSDRRSSSKYENFQSTDSASFREYYTNKRGADNSVAGILFGSCLKRSGDCGILASRLEETRF
jgi:hypothetical protein